MLCKGYSQVGASVSCLVTSWDPRQSCDVSTSDTPELKLEGSVHWGMFTSWQECHCRRWEGTSRSQLCAFLGSSSTLHGTVDEIRWNMPFVKMKQKTSTPTTLESWKWNTIWGGGITDKYNPGWATDLWKFRNTEQWEGSTSKQV